jgi:hypothetical protein
MRLSGHGLDCELHFSGPDAEDWMLTAVRVKTPAFEGAFNCTVQLGEWNAFVQELQQLESSIGRDAVASWANMEENIELQFTLHRLGTLTCSYKFSPNTMSLGPTLSGAFEADQTFLSVWIREAQEAVENAR